MAYYCDDSDNRLTSVVAGGVTTSMVYDYDGNLVQKTVGGQVTRYVYAGGPAPVAEINVTAGTTKDFIQANGRTWGVMDATSNTYFHHDAIGSVVALSNNSGQVTDTYEYEPFGKVLDHQGTSTNDYQFVGGYGVRKLNDTLDTMGVRQYSEKVGRFTTQDPIGFKSDSSNFFEYVQNNPLINIDLTGLWTYATEYGTTGYGLSPLMIDAAPSVDYAFNLVIHHDAIVTYTTNGKHMNGSLHYVGLAVDLRTRDMTSSQRSATVSELKGALGTMFDILDEVDHIHVEYDPKKCTSDSDS